MIGFAVLFGLLAVFLAQIWLNNQADERLKSIDAQRKAAPPARSIVVANKPLRFGDELTSGALREMPWPDNALPAGAFGKIADLTSGKRVVLMPIDVNEAVLASKITGPGERVDVVLTRTGEKNTAVNDVVIQNVRVLAVDQLADQRADKPAVVKAVTIEVDPTDGQKVALAATVGTLSLLLRKAGEVTENDTRRVTTRDLTAAPALDSHFVTVGVMRPSKGERVEYTVPVEEGDAHSAALSSQLPARN